MEFRREEEAAAQKTKALFRDNTKTQLKNHAVPRAADAKLRHEGVNSVR